MRVNVGLLSVLTLSATLGSALAQDQPAKTTKEPERKADTQAIGDILAAFVKAYNAKDAKAIGALFTPEAEIEDEDSDITRGREDIIARFSGYFAGGESGTVSIESESLRFLGADLAIEDGVVSIVSGAKANLARIAIVRSMLAKGANGFRPGSATSRRRKPRLTSTCLNCPGCSANGSTKATTRLS